jgi:hypothetical protein
VAVDVDASDVGSDACSSAPLCPRCPDLSRLVPTRAVPPSICTPHAHRRHLNLDEQRPPYRLRPVRNLQGAMRQEGAVFAMRR